MRQASRATAFAAVVVALLSGGNAAAQARPADPETPTRRTYDEVIGIIGDRVILQSTIDAELRERFRGQELTETDRRRREHEILMEIAREEIWVQYGKVLGQQAPEAFEQIVEREIQKKMDDLVNLYGSYTRMNAELEEIGESVAAMREQYRKELLGDIAREEAVHKRLRDQLPLLVTPREMRRYFDENQAEFAARTEGDIAWVSFPIDRPEKSLQEHLAAAREAWQREGMTAGDLASRFRGVAMPTRRDVRPVPDDPHAAFLKKFVREAQEGEVSEPLRVGRTWSLLRMQRKLDQKERRFDDQEVQNEIRGKLRDQKYDELNRRILVRNSQKLLVWPSWLLGDF